MSCKLICFGHRGAMGHAPENTLLSVETALGLGASWIEIDVYWADGHLVVIHDERLERTTNGTGYVTERGFAYLRSLDAGEGQRIPTLEEIFDRIGGRAGINVELKGPGTAEPVVRLIQARLKHGWTRERLLVSSFNHRELLRVKQLDTSIPTGALIVGLPVENAAFAAELGCSSVHPSLEFIDAAFVADAHGRGLKVFVFTVDEPEDMTRMCSLGVDGMFSNYPERVIEHIRSHDAWTF